ncbi:MAG TPA: hypothetical protein PKA27_11235 [Fimbriimonadaceae bacterium]|nr:hypothetical protein [Fimbriimonadaceae bacterium]
MRYSFYEEFLSERPPASTLLSNASLYFGEEVKASYHLIFIPAPCEVIGFHFGARAGVEEEVLPTNAKARFWIQTANTDNYLPYRVIPGSDTRYLNSTNDFEVDIGWFTATFEYPLLDDGDLMQRVILNNPVRIDVPGLYWIGWAHESVGGGEYLASTVQGMPFGLKDLVFTGTTHPTDVNGFNPPEVLNTANVEITSENYPKINIALVCQLIPPDVPLCG